MTWKQIEKAREIRLWIVQIVAPAALVTAYLASIPEVRANVKEKVDKVKSAIKGKEKK